MNEEDRCWCGSLLKDRPHNCIGTKERIQGLLDENVKLLGELKKSQEELRVALDAFQEAPARESLFPTAHDLKILRAAREWSGVCEAHGLSDCRTCSEKENVGCQKCGGDHALH